MTSVARIDEPHVIWLLRVPHKRGIPSRALGERGSASFGSRLKACGAATVRVCIRGARSRTAYGVGTVGRRRPRGGRERGNGRSVL